MTDQASIHPIIMMTLIVVSIGLVAGITYIYTNRNLRVTVLLSLLSIFTVVMLKVVGMVSIEIHTHFIGAIDEKNMAQIAAKPGWYQILYAWHIWLLPVIFVAFIFCILLYLIWTLKSQAKTTEVLPTATSPIKTSAYQPQTRAERLSSFMAMDAAKKESQQVNEKLAEALLMNAAYEIKVSDMTMNMHDLERELQELKRTSQDEMTTLKLELSAKQKENDYIAQQLSERSRDLLRAQEMFEKLLAMQKQNK